MNNTDYLFRGYNIFYGNPYPLSGEVDPGFKNLIFDISYKQKLLSEDRRYEIPDGSSLKQVLACDISTTNTEITGETSYKNTLGIEASVSGSVKGIEFSASLEF